MPQHQPFVRSSGSAGPASCLPPGTAGDWRGLLTTLTSDRRSPVKEALATPLVLWLLRKVYVDTRTNPTELCDTNRFPTAGAVGEHLLSHLVDAHHRQPTPERGR